LLINHYNFYFLNSYIFIATYVKLSIISLNPLSLTNLSRAE